MTYTEAWKTIDPVSRLDGSDIDRDPNVGACRARMERIALLLDSAFTIPGTSVRIGADALLNLIPALGPIVAKALAGYIILEASRAGAPKSTLVRMAGNVGLDLMISSVPIIGWFGDVFFRANVKNIELLKKHLDARSGIVMF